MCSVAESLSLSLRGEVGAGPTMSRQSEGRMVAGTCRLLLLVRLLEVGGPPGGISVACRPFYVSLHPGSLL